MSSEPYPTIHMGFILVIFAAVSFDMKAWFLGSVLLIFGLLFFWANLTSN